jgi:hypothetical protein
VHPKRQLLNHLQKLLQRYVVRLAQSLRPRMSMLQMQIQFPQHLLQIL